MKFITTVYSKNLNVTNQQLVLNFRVGYERPLYANGYSRRPCCSDQSCNWSTGSLSFIERGRERK